jgi:hypothetical protein
VQATVRCAICGRVTVVEVRIVSVGCGGVSAEMDARPARRHVAGHIAAWKRRRQG